MEMSRDLLYVASKKYICALDPADGSEVWRTKLPEVSSGVITLLVRGDDIYAGSYGHVFCLSRADGHIVWQNELPKMGYQHVILAMEDADGNGDQAAAMAELAERRAAASSGATAATVS